MTTLTDTIRPTQPAGTFSQTRLVAGRNLRHIKADPEQLVNMTVFPLMFLLLFVYVFGGAIADSSREYLQFALPGILVSSVAIASMQTAVSLAVDFQRGIVDRFRSLPISRSAVVSGRITADSVRMVWGTLLILGFGMILGFRPTGGIGGVVAAIVLVAAFGLVLCWPMAILGVSAGAVETANNMSFLIVLPLTFASSVYAPPDTMPAGLAAFARANPISHAADATRALLHGEPASAAVGSALLWMVAITVVCAPLAVMRFRQTG